ncbi:MAG: 4'-phosphopantetheinyl transferase superfamily protein [Gammaproteobacteria bacterium]|nr:4'-phosphopantetheinyl transferase superfamily protein [Gammaproteobacteria bacterium]
MEFANDTSCAPTQWRQWPPSHALDPAGVHLWRIDLDAFPADPGLLSADERQRLELIVSPVQARRFIASRCALRLLLGQISGLPPQTLVFQRSPEGKPRLAEPADLHFNLSHSGELVLLGISWLAPLGLDLEPIRNRSQQLAIARRVLPPERLEPILQAQDEKTQTQAFTAEWVRFEALQKMTGAGIFGPKHWPAHQLQALVPQPGWLAACAIAIAPDQALSWHFWQADAR